MEPFRLCRGRSVAHPCAGQKFADGGATRTFVKTGTGTDKAFLEFEGRTLLARMLEIARSVTAEVRIVGDAAKFAAFAPVVEDCFADAGRWRESMRH